MGYIIDARLEDGKPRLQVLDVDSGTIRMTWVPRDEADEGQAELKRLFWGLFLLSTRQRLEMEQREAQRPEDDGYATVDDV